MAQPQRRTTNRGFRYDFATVPISNSTISAPLTIDVGTPAKLGPAKLSPAPAIKLDGVVAIRVSNFGPSRLTLSSVSDNPDSGIIIPAGTTSERIPIHMQRPPTRYLHVAGGGAQTKASVEVFLAMSIDESLIPPTP